MNFQLQILRWIPLVFLVLSSCASINSVSLTPIPVDRKSPVRVQKDKVIFLGFNFDNDLVDDLVSDLRRQCPNGKVSGILTKDENINYFLYIVWKKQITASGYCVSSTSAKNVMKKNRGTASDADGNVDDPEAGL